MSEPRTRVDQVEVRVGEDDAIVCTPEIAWRYFHPAQSAAERHQVTAALVAHGLADWVKPR